MAKKKITFTLSSVPRVEKIFFVQNLGLMLKTGFSIGDALGVLAQQSKNKLLKKTIDGLYTAITKGQSFAAALRDHPAVFDDLFVNMVEAGELSGTLENTLQQVTIQMKKSYALKKKIRNAMLYPVIVLVLMVVMGTLIFIYVIPQILALYSGNTYNIPLPTRVVLAISGFVTGQPLMIVLGILVLVGIAYGIWKMPTGRYIVSKMILRAPIFGNIVKQINIAKITRVLHSLLVTDIPIIKSFEIIANTIGNSVYKKHLISTTASLSKGQSIYSVLSDRPDLFEPVITQMIKVGENTGSLDDMTNEIATFYEAEVDSTMSSLTVIIEPLLMIIMGFGVGFLAVAVIMPIYGLVDQI